MADHLKPTIASTYSNFVTEMDARFDDLAVGLDPAVTTATNVPTNAVRWSGAVNKWQKYNGSTWADLAAAYAIDISGNAATATNGVVTSTNYADPAWITSLSGAKIVGAIPGNAATATVLQTARTINGVSFNGSANINVNTVNAVTFNNSGTGVASGTTFNGSTARTISHNTIGAVSLTGTYADPSWITSLASSKLTGQVAVANGGTGSSSVQGALFNLGAIGNTTIARTSQFTVGSGVSGRGVVFLCSGTFSVDFPIAATAGNGYNFGVVNTGTGAITLDPYLTETIDGSTTKVLSPGQSCIIVCDGSTWRTLGLSGGGASGGGVDQIFYENSNTITTSYTLTTNNNAMSAGPLTVASGVTVTVPTGSTWTIV
jgi:hypothetical protein